MLIGIGICSRPCLIIHNTPKPAWNPNSSSEKVFPVETNIWCFLICWCSRGVTYIWPWKVGRALQVKTEGWKSTIPMETRDYCNTPTRFSSTSAKIGMYIYIYIYIYIIVFDIILFYILSNYNIILYLLYHILLYYILLYYMLLYFFMLLFYFLFFYIILHFIFILLFLVYYIILYYIISYDIILNYIKLYYIIWYDIILYYIILYVVRELSHVSMYFPCSAFQTSR